MGDMGEEWREVAFHLLMGVYISHVLGHYSPVSPSRGHMGHLRTTLPTWVRFVCGPSLFSD